MTRFRILLLFLIPSALVLSVADGFAQNTTGLWTGGDVNYEVNKKTDITLETQARFTDNISQLNKWYVEPDVSYVVHKKISAGFSYRFSTRVYNKTDPFDIDKKISHRYSVYCKTTNMLKGMDFFKRWELHFRLKGQLELNKVSLPEKTLRFKTALFYNVKGLPLDAFVAHELFYGLAYNYSYGASEIRSNNLLYQNRITAGVKWKYSKSLRFDFFYLLKRESATNEHILGITASYALQKPGSQAEN